MQIKRIIPNSLTCANLLCGSAAVFMATQEQYLWAFALILAGGLFDFFDGASARWLKVPSPLGVQLDSLADDITFGLAPAMILMCYLKPIIGWWALIALLIAAFSALRLAKFNVDDRQTSSFIGLPIPANAIFWIGFVAFYYEIGGILNWLTLAAIVVMSWLMLSSIRIYSLKFKNYSFKENSHRYILMIAAIVFVAIGGLMGMAITILYYVLSAVAMRFRAGLK